MNEIYSEDRGMNRAAAHEAARQQAREFLRSRRSRIGPQQAGMVGGARRRVAGLRREEVAMLAGVSTDYYAKMERGALAGVSPEILDAVAHALHLDEAETDHLHDLAREAGPVPTRRRNGTPAGTVRPSLQRLLDAITAAPAWIVDTRKDLLATNDLGRALMSPLLQDPVCAGNNARFIFLSPASRIFYPEWEQAADSTVASMRSAAGRNPHDKPLTDLVGELVTRSDDFRLRWSAHNVRFHRSGVKRIHHPDVGDLEFAFEGLEQPDRSGCVLYAYTSAAGSVTEERVKLLSSIAATNVAGNADASTARASQDS